VPRKPKTHADYTISEWVNIETKNSLTFLLTERFS
jgi:hypothetical protein